MEVKEFCNWQPEYSSNQLVALSLSFSLLLFPSYTLQPSSFIHSFLEYQYFFSSSFVRMVLLVALAIEFSHPFLLRPSSLIHTYFINLTVYQLSIVYNVWISFPPFFVCCFAINADRTKSTEQNVELKIHWAQKNKQTITITKNEQRWGTLQPNTKKNVAYH